MKLLALLHGLGMMPQTWQDIIVSMPSDRYKAVAPWLKGLRPGRQDGFSVSAACDDIVALLNPNGVDSLALIGSDLGATIALATAVRSPGSVSDLVIEATSAAYSPLAITAQKTMLKMAPAGRWREAGLDKGLLIAVLDGLSGLDLVDQLPTVTARTLVVAGGADKASIAMGQALVDAIPGSRLEVVPDADRFVHLSASEAFSSLTWEFLDARPA